MAGQDAERRARGQVSAGHAVDITDERALAAAFGAVTDMSGRIDILFNVAGIWRQGLIEGLDPDTWGRIFAANVRAIASCCRLVVSIMVPGWRLHRQHGVDFGSARRRRLGRLQHDEVRRHHPHPVPRLGGRFARHPRQCRVLGTDRHGGQHEGDRRGHGARLRQCLRDPAHGYRRGGGRRHALSRVRRCELCHRRSLGRRRWPDGANPTSRPEPHQPCA
ncbi:MAG: SDR family oxidoreductase [Alphaproteobacteria bacterium]|nr:SDR family oxidoreductase [Alphaproteobacteria bacterium]